ncbi:MULTISPECIES: cysteine desulfurase family protein [Enterococcus]|uniref:cysteine desulfurase n=1 Tax=Enterococcus sulfureus ATCC 49903 TaxID=1140003 RepID=S0KY12_9ENTE|nr:cysteine desulfurase family protein [Enterococcus sulfureus]EOT49497.1 cysteine desulfurase [Enterococcus sulfureus ATCC 49903]EOT87364.1 cysteine desulfurase [Enterococcus sulfureus ATCC 49903]
MTYFDHAATTPMHPNVIGVMTEYMKTTFGNPSSIHQYGRQAHEKLEEARQVIAASIHATPNEIIFTSGGTEGDNTAILQTARARQHLGKHLITTQVEHPAVLEAMHHLQEEGFDVTYLPVNTEGELTAQQVQQALREDTILVSVMFANNETGNLYPIKEIGDVLREHQAYFHTDAVQAYGKYPIDVTALGIDLLSISAHKINGPKGVGFLYQKQTIVLPPLFHGGEQEAKRRAGTENLISILGMAEAVKIMREYSFEERQDQYAGFTKYLLAQLDQAAICYHVNGSMNRLSHVVNLSFPGVANDLLLMHLDLAGFAISTGSACTAGTVHPSHVLEAMYGKGDPYISSAIRMSFGLENTQSEVERFSQILINTILRLKK